jgi:hypothetical protein
MKAVGPKSVIFGTVHSFPEVASFQRRLRMLERGILVHVSRTVEVREFWHTLGTQTSRQTQENSEFWLTDSQSTIPEDISDPSTIWHTSRTQTLQITKRNRSLRLIPSQSTLRFAQIKRSRHLTIETHTVGAQGRESLPRR